MPPFNCTLITMKIESFSYSTTKDYSKVPVKDLQTEKFDIFLGNAEKHDCATVGFCHVVFHEFDLTFHDLIDDDLLKSYQIAETVGDKNYLNFYNKLFNRMMNCVTPQILKEMLNHEKTKN